MIEVRFFAAARDAAGVSSERRDEATVGELRSALVRDHPALGAVLGHCALLVDGTRRGDDHGLADAERADVLPPFAGG
ncbi:molybdopterin synthase sulfur carrier subunit [Aeromicrobium sp. Root495]|uniref:MoaD/ThiS family protein n=1 Tax=Aeromicrobium sp. Root495 TaxID=1736550 RepID=UPI0006F8D362|nr:MoaD/ThiS family protein [Aeromicrobium sp. Root495]KQY59827.1 molybdopterin synthase sulfur carrier subunit [Aeromicrobium sp. Root495]